MVILALIIFRRPSAILIACSGPALGVLWAEGWLHLHLFPSAQIAQVRVDSIAHELPHPIIDWVAPPHFFRCEAVIALYLGDDARVIETLTGVCGAPFAP